MFDSYAVDIDKQSELDVSNIMPYVEMKVCSGSQLSFIVIRVRTNAVLFIRHLVLQMFSGSSYEAKNILGSIKNWIRAGGLALKFKFMKKSPKRFSVSKLRILRDLSWCDMKSIWSRRLSKSSMIKYQILRGQCPEQEQIVTTIMPWLTLKRRTAKMSSLC